MNIRPVTTPADLQVFMHLPYRLYRHNPVWVPPLRDEVHGQFDPVRNPTLDHTRYPSSCWRTAGRWLGASRPSWIPWPTITGANRWGCLAITNVPTIPRPAACCWTPQRTGCAARACQSMRGPWSFVSQEWGSVVEGYEPSPVVMSPYNPPYYNVQYAEYGLTKVKDLLVYVIDAREGYRVPPRILTLTDKVSQTLRGKSAPSGYAASGCRGGYPDRTLQPKPGGQLGLRPGHRGRGARHGTGSQANPACQGCALRRRPAGKPIGFAIAIPDVNLILRGLNGRLLPFGWAKLLWMLPRLHQYRMFALGVLPEYHGKGVDSLIYRALYDSLFSPDLRMEINYVLEDNGPMNNAILKLGARPLRRYRIYQKTI